MILGFLRTLNPLVHITPEYSLFTSAVACFLVPTELPAIAVIMSFSFSSYDARLGNSCTAYWVELMISNEWVFISDNST